MEVPRWYFTSPDMDQSSFFFPYFSIR